MDVLLCWKNFNVNLRPTIRHCINLYVLQDGTDILEIIHYYYYYYYYY